MTLEEVKEVLRMLQKNTYGGMQEARRALEETLERLERDQ